MYPTYAPVHDPTAVMGRRFGAWIIDFVIGAIVVFVLFVAFATRESYGSSSRAEAVCDDINANRSDYICVPADTEVFLWKDTDLLVIALVGSGFWFLNDAVLTGITGFSIGKGIVGLRVVRQRDGQLAGFGRSSARWAMWIADWAPYCIPIVGLATANATKGHRRVGDMVAGTFVVDKNQVGIAPQVPGVTVGGATGYPAPMPWPGAPTPGGYPPAWGAPPAPPGTAPWGQPTPSAPTWGAPGSQHGTPPMSAPPPWAQPSPRPPAAPGDTGPMWAPPPAPGGDPTLVQPALGGEPPTQQLPAISPPVVTGGPGVDGPLWDDARDAYIQWDPDINRWVQWDETTRQWHPL